MRDAPQLTPREVVIVRGWYGGDRLSDIGAAIGLSTFGLAGAIRQMRRRGIALTPRPAAPRASRGGARG